MLSKVLIECMLGMTFIAIVMSCNVAFTKNITYNKQKILIGALASFISAILLFASKLL